MDQQVFFVDLVVQEDVITTHGDKVDLHLFKLPDLDPPLRSEHLDDIFILHGAVNGNSQPPAWRHV
jgi:hypothetical protein